MLSEGTSKVCPSLPFLGSYCKSTPSGSGLSGFFVRATERIAPGFYVVDILFRTGLISPYPNSGGFIVAYSRGKGILLSRPINDA